MNEKKTAAESFDRLVDSYYRAWFRYHPEAAVDAGVKGYEHLLTPYSDEDRGALVCLNDEILVGLEEIDRSRLDADREIDFQLLYGAARLENQRLLDLEPHRPDPQRMLPVNALYQLTIRPVENFHDALLARLNAIPGHMSGAIDYLRPKGHDTPVLWVRSAIMAARRGTEFIHELPNHPAVAGRSNEFSGLQPAVHKAARAIAEFADFLEREVTSKAKGDLACGTAYFEGMLKQRHFLDVSAGSLYELGQELVEQTQRDLKDACRKFAGHEDIAAVTRQIQAGYPPADKLIAEYREQMLAARRFVTDQDLVSLPGAERLDVVETPVFLRHQIPFAAYNEPAPNDPKQQGYYYVTPPGNEAELAEHNYAGLMHTCAHEAWPGHHLQFVTANLNPVARTLPRLLNPSATLYEGWALYCEQLMHEQGFLNRPEQRPILLRDRLWRALRILIDVDLHTRGLNEEAAAERLVTNLGFSRPKALAEITWYSRSPTVPLGYATGWALINALRDRQQAENRELKLKGFHDRLLSSGSIALPLAIRRAFGLKAWQSVRNILFGEAVQATA